MLPTPKSDRRQSRAFQRAASRLTSRPLGRAFDTWAEQLVLDQTRRRVALRWWSSQLGAAWASWEEALEGAHRLRAAARAFGNASFLRCLNTWCEWTDERGRRLRLLKATVHTLQGNGVRAALNSWLVAAHLSGAQRRALHLLLHRAVVKAMNSWNDYAAQVKLLRLAAYSFVHPCMHP